MRSGVRVVMVELRVASCVFFVVLGAGFFLVGDVEAGVEEAQLALEVVFLGGEVAVGEVPGAAQGVCAGAGEGGDAQEVAEDEEADAELCAGGLPCPGGGGEQEAVEGVNEGGAVLLVPGAQGLLRAGGEGGPEGCGEVRRGGGGLRLRWAEGGGGYHGGIYELLMTS